MIETTFIYVTSEKVSQFKMPLKSIDTKKIRFKEKKFIIWTS